MKASRKVSSITERDRAAQMTEEVPRADEQPGVAEVGRAQVGGARRFPIRLGRMSRPVLWLFGVSDDNAYVDLDDHLDARFGFFRLNTPVSNITSWSIEGPWLWLRAIGVRRSIRHGDLTFGGNHRGGVRLDFREPAGERFVQTRALYLTVGDLEGFAAALAARGIPGEDARQRR